MDYLAPHAYEVAARFRAMGKIVIGGGSFASTFPEEVQPHFDAILVGEAQQMWPRMVDLVAGRLQHRYDAPLESCLADMPPPRYDLAERHTQHPSSPRPPAAAPIRHILSAQHPSCSPPGCARSPT